MTVPHYINEHTSDIRAIKPGWYAMESTGKLSSGPFANKATCLTGIVQPSSNFRASPRFAQAIKCPECGNQHVRVWTRLDAYGRVWTDNSCHTCGHKLSPKAIGRPVVNQMEGARLQETR
jgi:ribosomal protein S27E